ncbi:MAG: purine-nucleoside phosphorylase, partial [Bacteroidales bacterium]
QSFSVGDLMIIRDHINLMPNPLIGPNLDAFGERFPDMTAAYDLDLIARAEKIAKKAKIPVRKGVYLGNTGPSYETPAEVRYYISIGADAVGMSTVPEVLVARHCGIPVFGMSVITNVSNTDNASTVLNDGDDVVRAADAAADRMCAIFQKLIETI